MRFSARLHAGKHPRTLVFEDAPRKTRIGFIKTVMPEFFQSSSTGYGTRQPTLDARSAHEAFIALIRDESETWDYDPESSSAALAAHLKSCEWPEFYDFVELMGQLLLKKDEDVPFGEGDCFERYAKKVNALLHEDGIGWVLDSKSHLARQVSKQSSKRAAAARDVLVDRFAPARVHFQKATEYLYRHPVDEANSIKEIISAVESVARVVAPGASTLGDALKALRRTGACSSLLLDSLEKLYAYSNATPQVRHGHPSSGAPSLPEAELAYSIGIAFIIYLAAVHAEA